MSARIPPCLDRRRFLADTGLLAVGVLLANACGDGQIGNVPTDPGGASSTATVRVADYPALGTVGGIARITGTSRPIAVVRSGADSYRAFSLICTHQGSTVNIVAGPSFQCPNHGARFAATGEWTGGQPTSNLRELTVTRDAVAGTLSITY